MSVDGVKNSHTTYRNSSAFNARRPASMPGFHPADTPATTVHKSRRWFSITDFRKSIVRNLSYFNRVPPEVARI